MHQRCLFTSCLLGTATIVRVKAYIFAALLVNGVFHEAGHALAALGEGVRVISCGAFITAM